MANIPGIMATSPAAIERAAQMWSDMKLSHHVNAKSHSRAITGPDEDGFCYLKLSLGCTEVEVGFDVACGQVFVQGAVIHEGWVDVNCFSPSVKNDWTLAIEKELNL